MSWGPAPKPSQKALSRPQAAGKPPPAPDWPALHQAMLQRQQGLCWASGLPLGDRVNHHHRRGGAGRTHGLANLVALRPDWHTLQPYSVHMRPEWARGRGLIVRQAADPAAVVLWLPDGRPVLLDDEGGFEELQLGVTDGQVVR